MKAAFTRMLPVLIAAALLAGCTQSGGVLRTVPPVGEGEAACLAFVQEKLTGDGGIHTNYLRGSQSGELAAGHEVLSESQGLMLLYYAATADRWWFETTLAFVQEKLDSGTLLSYRIGEDGAPFPLNASVDDLRIIHGLLEGAAVFSEPDYRRLGSLYAGRLYQTNVENDILLDFYDETYQIAGRVSTLCFADLQTMQQLGKRDKRWKKVEKKMRQILLDGYLGDAFPFFETRYLPDAGSYSSERVRMVEALLTALHLSQVEACPPQTLRWLEESLPDGAVFGEYTIEGEPASAVESTAVYALCALLGISENSPALVQAAVSKLSAFQVTDPQSKLYGAFANAATKEAFSFDNLMALSALRAQAEFYAINGKGDLD